MISLVIDLHWLYLKTMKIETLLVYSSFCKSIQMDYVKCSNWLLHCIFSDLEVGIMFWEIKKSSDFLLWIHMNFARKFTAHHFLWSLVPLKPQDILRIRSGFCIRKQIVIFLLILWCHNHDQKAFLSIHNIANAY